jgi:hypothetical protein
MKPSEKEPDSVKIMVPSSNPSPFRIAIGIFHFCVQKFQDLLFLIYITKGNAGAKKISKCNNNF